MKLGDLFPHIEPRVFAGMLRQFKWDQPGLDCHKLKTLAVACGYAYADATPFDRTTGRDILIPSVIKALVDMGHLESFTPEIGDFEGLELEYVLTDATVALTIRIGNKLIIAVRGSKPPWNIPPVDWIVNLSRKPQEITGLAGAFHNGFAKEAENLVSALCGKNPAQKDYLFGIESMAITGHSLGGAIGSLASAILQIDAPHISQNVVSVFGTPRIADQTGVQVFNHVTFIRREKDYIPGLQHNRSNPSNVYLLGRGIYRQEQPPQPADAWVQDAIAHCGDHKMELYIIDALRLNGQNCAGANPAPAQPAANPQPQQAPWEPGI